MLALFTVFAAGPAGGTMDAETIECLSCHSAELAKEAWQDIIAMPGHDHPIGDDYPALAAKNPGYRPASSLDPNIKLIDSKIGCRTCHVPYGNEETHKSLTGKRKQYPAIPDPMLNMDNRKNELCGACHVK